MTQSLLEEERGPGFDQLGQAPGQAPTQAPGYEPSPRQPLLLDSGPVLGQVITVDASRVLVRLADESAIDQANVSALVAARAGNGFLIGILDRLICDATDTRVTAEIMPVGTFYPSADGGGSFRPGAAAQPRIRAACYLVDGERLDGFMSTLTQGVAHDERLLLGHYGGPDGAEAVADGNKLFQRHMAILGNSGAGKSWAVSLLLERASRLANANVLVLDLHGEYGPLDPGGVATRLRIGGPADLLYGADDVLHLPYWMFEADELLTLIGNPDDPNASDQRLWLIDRVETLKRSALASAGSFDAMNTVTADSPVPYAIDLLLEWMEKDEVEKIIQQPSGHVLPGPYNGKLRGLISRLEARRADPRYGFIFQPPQNTETKEWLSQMAVKLLSAGQGTGGIKTIDLSEVPNTLTPLVTGLIARIVYSIQFWMEPSERTPVCLICDEAHVYLRDDETDLMYTAALQKFEMIAKEGRKYGVCLGIVSQRPSELSRTVLSQCNNFLLLRLNNDQDHKMIIHLVPGALGGVAGLLPTLDVGEAVAIGDAVPLPVRIKLDKAEVGPASATMPYWTYWSTKPSSMEAIVDGVSALRSQSRYLDED